MAITGAVGAALRQDAPYQAEIQMGAQLIMDFQGARSGRRPYYWYRGTRYARPEKIPGWSFSRASVGYAEDSAGNLIAFPANEPRITDKGLLIEEARTNYVWNNVMAGAVLGSPGAAPTYWVPSGSSPAAVGLTQTIAAGTENGLAYLEITLSGTPTTTGGTGYYFTGTTENVLVSPGQTWTASAYARLIGAATGVTSFTLSIVERDVGGASTGSSATTMALGSAMARFAHTRTMSGGATVKAQANAGVNFTSGVPLNVTYRLYAPQMEQGSFATSPILTATGVATRAADNVSITGLSFALSGGVPLTVQARFLPLDLSINRRVFSLNAGGFSTNNSVELLLNSGAGGRVDLQVKQAGSIQAYVSRPAATLNASNGAAVRIAGGNASLSSIGSAVSTIAVAASPDLTQLDIGRSADTSGNLSGYVQKLAFFGDVIDAQLTRLAA